MAKASKSVKTAGKAAIEKPGEGKPALHAIKGGKSVAGMSAAGMAAPAKSPPPSLPP